MALELLGWADAEGGNAPLVPLLCRCLRALAAAASAAPAPAPDAALAMDASGDADEGSDEEEGPDAARFVWEAMVEGR